MPTGLRATAVFALAALAFGTPAAASFVTFESGHVRPLARVGTRLYAVNTPDNRLEIFDVTGGGLTHLASVPVGMEPVAVAARSATEVWVVNHLSDSVSVVDVGATPPRVIRTLLVGDEPRDIVFAGPGGNRAFITTAHRGQNSGVALADLTTEGIGRADVWVFDATNLGPTTLGGTSIARVTLFGDTPRALAVTNDSDGGTTVYAAVFHSGNQTTTLSDGIVCNGPTATPCTVFGTTVPGGLPLPKGPEVGLIVRFDNGLGQWRDQLGRNWNNAVRFSLPDSDVFSIDADAAPAALAAVSSWAHVGTVLFNMVSNPVSDKIYVSNTEARNEVRFEGPGGGGSTVRGHLHEARITVLDGPNVIPRHLNKHINYGVVPSPAGVAEDSLATPLGMAVTNDGLTLYVAAFGSSKIGVFDTAALEGNTFTPDSANHIVVDGGGPSGIVLDEANDRLFVTTRFDNAVVAIDTVTETETARVSMHTPEPTHVIDGRPVLYDALLSSSNGEAACAACHVFGDFDSLAWDLGNPNEPVLNNPNPIRFNVGQDPDFQPLKGPMTTQSLRGMANHGPMHWRGDRTGGNDPGGDPLAEDQAFKKFIVAFDGLLGRNGPISLLDMQRFTDFILDVTYPPNPIRNLNNNLVGAQLTGRNLFFGRNTDVVFNCDGCHVLDPGAGFFGGDGQTTFENETQMFKVPHLRNLYQKVGMFGMPRVPFLGADGPFTDQGPQVRGFGFLHDGSVDTLQRFHGAAVFDTSLAEEQTLEQFMLAFDSNLKPMVGQQVTLTSSNTATAGARITEMITQDTAGDCEVVVKGTVAGLARGWYRTPAGTFQSDRSLDAPLTDAALRALATGGQELTYTCVPPGSGERVGVDRDEDGFYDRDELDAGSDPADPDSTPGGGGTTTTSTSVTVTTVTSTTSTSIPGAPCQGILGKRLLVRNPSSPTRRKFVILAKEAASTNAIVGNPMTAGATLRLHVLGNTETEQVFILNPGSAFWETLAGGAGYRYTDPNADNGPLKLLIVKRTPGGTFVLKAVGNSRLSPIDVLPPQGGDFAVVTFRIVGGDAYSIGYGGPFGGTERNDSATTYRVVGPTAEGNICE
jgi:YVTN family beta-propeller protein